MVEWPCSIRRSWSGAFVCDLGSAWLTEFAESVCRCRSWRLLTRCVWGWCLYWSASSQHWQPAILATTISSVPSYYHSHSLFLSKWLALSSYFLPKLVSITSLELSQLSFSSPLLVYHPYLSFFPSFSPLFPFVFLPFSSSFLTASEILIFFLIISLSFSTTTS